MPAAESTPSARPGAPGESSGGSPGDGRRRSVVPIAALLIGVGVLLLALQLGALQLGAVLAVLALWPLALVALGVDLLTRGRWRTPIWIALAIVAALAATGRLGPLGNALGVPDPRVAAAGDAETITLDVPRDGARALELELDAGVADLALGVTRGPALIDGTVRTAPDQRLDQRVERDGGTVRAEFETQSVRGFSFFRGVRSNDGRVWRLGVAPGVPLELDVATGVGRTELDLRELALRDLSVDAGVGEVEVALPLRGGWEGRIDAGVGEVVVRVPRGAAVRVSADSGIGSVEARGLERVGDAWQTAGYDAAPLGERATLSIDGGLGSIELRAE